MYNANSSSIWMILKYVVNVIILNNILACMLPIGLSFPDIRRNMSVNGEFPHLFAKGDLRMTLTLACLVKVIVL